MHKQLTPLPKAQDKTEIHRHCMQKTLFDEIQSNILVKASRRNCCRSSEEKIS
jgi:hypothetical protein